MFKFFCCTQSKNKIRFLKVKLNKEINEMFTVKDRKLLFPDPLN